MRRRHDGSCACDPHDTHRFRDDGEDVVCHPFPKPHVRRLKHFVPPANPLRDAEHLLFNGPKNSTLLLNDARDEHGLADQAGGCEQIGRRRLTVMDLGQPGNRREQ